MQPKNLGSLLAAPVLALAFGACGSGGIGDILGGPGNDTSDSRADLRGEIVEVDQSARRIVVESNDIDSRSDLRPQRREATVYYDDRTVVEFGGATYRPEDLERGDEVDIRFARSGDSDVAEHITVLRDARAGLPDDDDDPATVRGTVGDIESGARRFEVEPFGDRDSRLVYYDERTIVLFEGKEYQTSSLERGDEVSVTGERRDGRFLADRITVERDATPSSSGTNDDDLDDVRGTVRSVDSRDRRIELDLAQGERGDERVFYDSGTVVDLRGRQVSPESLRDGDEVAVSGSRRNGQFVADTIRVVREAAE